MTQILTRLRLAAFPPVPIHIMDDYNLFRAKRMQDQCRLLFLALLLTVPTAIYGASDGASVWVSYVLPGVVAGFFLFGFLSLQGIRHGRISPRGARKFIRNATSFSAAIAIPCSIWAVFSWLSAPPEMRAYYPLIVAMGSLTTSYCLASVRLAAVLNMVIGLAPISLLMLFSGNRMDFAASVSLIMAMTFLLRMIAGQHAQWTELLMLQHIMREQANTDPLTGLLNRRALNERVEFEIAKDIGSDRGFSIAILDLDGFKPVNDRHGHAAGDMVLRSIATRLVKCCDEGALVARLGGDEFAILCPEGYKISREAMAAHILTALVPPHNVNGLNISVGASIGVAHMPEDGATMSQLLEAADRKLYEAKSQRGETPSQQEPREQVAAA